MSASIWCQIIKVAIILGNLKKDYKKTVLENTAIKILFQNRHYYFNSPTSGNSCGSTNIEC